MSCYVFFCTTFSLLEVFRTCSPGVKIKRRVSLNCDVILCKKASKNFGQNFFGLFKNRFSKWKSLFSNLLKISYKIFPLISDMDRHARSCTSEPKITSKQVKFFKERIEYFSLHQKYFSSRQIFHQKLWLSHFITFIFI